MGRSCVTCHHRHHAKIDEELASGRRSIKDIAAEYGIAPSTLNHHFHNHLPKALAMAHDADEATRADDLLGKLDEYESWLRGVVASGSRDRDFRLSVSAVSQLIRLTELLAKVRGQLTDNPVVNIIANPEFVQVRNAIMVALQPYPDAKAAVGAALLALEPPQ